MTRSAAARRPVTQGPQRHTLHPGDVRCGTRGDRLSTLLGSCVAIVLTDPRRTVGAMCHVVHAGAARPGAPRAAEYALDALDAMCRLLLARGIAARLCDAFVYGGANMFPDQYARQHVGAANAESVLRSLSDQQIRVVACDLGGTAYRQLTWTVGDTPPAVATSPLPPTGTTP